MAISASRVLRFTSAPSIVFRVSLRERLLRGSLRGRSVVRKLGRGPVVTPRSAVAGSSLFALPAEALLGVSGESHYSEAIRLVCRRGALSPRSLATSSEVALDVAVREPERELRWFEAQLLPTPDNPYDANAIAVVSSYGQVGHLPRGSAAEYAEVFARLHVLGYSGAICPAFVDAGRGCVVLVLSRSSVCLPAVNAERRKRAWSAWYERGDTEAAAARLGFGSLSSFLSGARQHAKEHGLDLPPTASELRR